MELYSKEFGMGAISMDMEFNNGLMENIIKEILRIAKNMEKERLFSLMVPIMKANLSVIK